MKQTVWHFTEKAGILRNGNPFEVGVALPTIKGGIKPCHNGYHGSPTVLDALNYAPGPHLYKRELSGTVKPHENPLDKYAGSRATATLFVGDVSRLLRVFACQCAADVFYLWSPPKIFRDYILTQDEGIRAAARAAAWAAAWAAARDAARDAARAAIKDSVWSYRDYQKIRLDEWMEAFIKDGTIPTVTIPKGPKA